MSRFCILIMLTLMSVYTKADHIVGYDMCLVNIKNSNGTPTDTYKWVVKLYRDVNGIPIPTSVAFQIYTSLNVSVGNFTCTKVNPQTFLTYPPGECPPVNAQLAIELGVYESPIINYASLNNTGGYYVSSSTCCRKNGILNVLAPSSNFGINFTMDFPSLSVGSLTRYNSSPEFTKNPLTFFSVGKLYSLNWQVVDPDGDSLVFSLAQPLDDGTIKPFNLIPYASGYGLNSNIMDGAPDITINPTTGIISFKPTIAGSYLVAFKVDEYRKIFGVPTKIGSVRREFQLNTKINIELPPVLSDQGNRLNTIKDTVYVTDSATYLNRFNAKEQVGDSIFLKIIPRVGLSQNILNSALFNVKWGKTGGVNYSGNAIKNLILASKDSIKTTFTWKLDSTDIKRTPYYFQIISFDKTCPTPLADTLSVELSVLGQCFQSSANTLVGCDSVTDYLGRTYYSSINLFDTVQSILGCDTILSQFITVKKSSKLNISVQGCDSVLAIDGKIYYQNDTVKMVVTNAKNCDSVITQKVLVYHTPIAQKINGDTVILNASTNYFYGTTPQTNVNYLWVVNKGTIISGQGTNVAEVQWLSAGQGTLKCMVSDLSNHCSDSSQLSVNITTSVYNPLNSTLKIFPNPTQNIINITGLTKNQATLVTLHDVQGKLITSTHILESGTLDLSTLAQGVYLLKVGEVVQRIIRIKN